MKFSRGPSWEFFGSAYFAVNLTLVLCYPLLRLFTAVGERSLRNRDSFGFTYENSIMYAGLTFVALYYVRSSSLREFIVNSLSIGKICVASLLFFARFRLCFAYIALCLLTWLLLSYPKYRGRHKFIRVDSEDHFDSLVDGSRKETRRQESEAYRYRDKTMFFVEFYADWLSLCSMVRLPLSEQGTVV